MAKRKSDEPKLQVVVKGETGEVVLQVFEDDVILAVRQPHHERWAEVRLTDPQVTAIQDALNQLGSVLDGDDGDD
jgi:predicted regulator of Ras-like GTPase activity (Roadblock/LC7/MglB family)